MMCSLQEAHSLPHTTKRSRGHACSSVTQRQLLLRSKCSRSLLRCYPAAGPRRSSASGANAAAPQANGQQGRGCDEGQRRLPRACSTHRGFGRRRQRRRLGRRWRGHSSRPAPIPAAANAAAAAAACFAAGGRRFGPSACRSFLVGSRCGRSAAPADERPRPQRRRAAARGSGGGCAVFLVGCRRRRNCSLPSSSFRRCSC